MDSHRWQRFKELFHQALEQPANQRLYFLQAHTGADTDLLEEVQGLLRRRLTSRITFRSKPGRNL